MKFMMMNGCDRQCSQNTKDPTKPFWENILWVMNNNIIRSKNHLMCCKSVENFQNSFTYWSMIPVAISMQIHNCCEPKDKFFRSIDDAHELWAWGRMRHWKTISNISMLSCKKWFKNLLVFFTRAECMEIYV